VVGTADPTASTTELASLMVGREVDLTVDKDAPKLGDESLVVRNLTIVDKKGNPILDDISFSIRAGEVLAIAGVQGNGQTELTEAILGLRHGVKGSVMLDGEELLGDSVRSILDAGVGFVPEDRQKDGLVGEFTVSENLMLDRSHGEPFARFANLRLSHREEFAEQAIKEFDIRTQGPDTLAGRLSGGNQQKVVLARELSRELRLLVASQPTRGLDVGSIEFVHERIIQTRDSGLPVLIVSTELDEVVGLADRIAVMYRGRIIGIVGADTPRATLGEMMAGIAA
jgi:simple sugar transport system ATP-binding protein